MEKHSVVSMAFTDKKIVVIGGGLGGLSFVNAALHSGLNVQAFEQASKYGEVGAGVKITQNAFNLLYRFGLEADFDAHSAVTSNIYMQYRHFRTGDVLANAEEYGELISRNIHRARLLEVLAKNIPPGVVHHSKRLKKYEARQSGGYDVFFEDGTNVYADIIVGCDGIKSLVRPSLGIPDSPVYSGQVVYRALLPPDDLPSDEAKEIFKETVNFRGPRRHVLTYPVGPPGPERRIGVIAFMSEPLEEWSQESWMATAPVESLEKHVAQWCPAVQDLILGLKRSDEIGEIMKQALYSRDPIDKWFETNGSQSGVVLMGDACHTTLPHQGIRILGLRRI